MHIIMKDATNRIIVFFKNSKKKIPMNEERERERYSVGYNMQIQKEEIKLILMR